VYGKKNFKNTVERTQTQHIANSPMIMSSRTTRRLKQSNTDINIQCRWCYFIYSIIDT